MTFLFLHYGLQRYAAHVIGYSAVGLHMAYVGICSGMDSNFKLTRM